MLAAGLWWAFDAGKRMTRGRAAGRTGFRGRCGAEHSRAGRSPSAELPRSGACGEHAERTAVTSGARPALRAGDRSHFLGHRAEPEPAGQVDTGETTAVLAPDMEAFGDTVEHKFSFYNPESHLPIPRTS